MKTTNFVIDGIVPVGDSQTVDVHVRWDGGGKIFNFPKTYPNATILAAIRNELRQRDVEMEKLGRLANLIGRHDC